MNSAFYGATAEPKSLVYLALQCDTQYYLLTSGESLSFVSQARYKQTLENFAVGPIMGIFNHFQ